MSMEAGLPCLTAAPCSTLRAFCPVALADTPCPVMNREALSM